MNVQTAEVSSPLKEMLNRIGENLYLIRQQRREKLSSVAHSVNITHAVLSQIENGKYSSLSLKLLIKITAYYGTEPASLMLKTFTSEIKEKEL